MLGVCPFIALQTLNLASNQLGSTIPSSWQQGMAGITSLILTGNAAMCGTLPPGWSLGGAPIVATAGTTLLGQVRLSLTYDSSTACCLACGRIARLPAISADFVQEYPRSTESLGGTLAATCEGVCSLCRLPSASSCYVLVLVQSCPLPPLPPNPPPLPPPSPPPPPSPVNALLFLRTAVQPSTWPAGLAGWDVGTPDVCTWGRVTCSGPNTPTAIDFTGLGLIGTLPPELSHLLTLQVCEKNGLPSLSTHLLPSHVSDGMQAACKCPPQRACG